MAVNPKILTEISQVTREIEDNYPELYKYIDENPMTLPDENNPDESNPEVDDQAFRDYLESLKSMLAKYKDEHENN